jgi:uncharacterized SAM-binding protein YcdF (DUF218 family)
LSLILLKALLRNLILPPAGPLLLGFLGLGSIKRHPTIGRVFVACSLVSLWVLSVPVVADALSGLIERYPALDSTQPTGAKAIVILGGGGQVARAPEYGGPAAEPILLERLSYGAYLARKTGLPILVTGGAIEAGAMRATLQRNFDMPVRWVDDQSGDTFQNAANSAKLLQEGGVKRILLVTHASHMARSVQEFMDAGIEVVPAPMGFASARGHGIDEYFPAPSGLLRSYLALYEMLGEQVRGFLVFTHLRRHQTSRAHC